MEIRIKDSMSIAELKTAFNGLFPYLKLEFFSKTHLPHRHSNLKFLLPDKTLLEEHNTNSSNSEIVVTPKMSVNELEQSFGKKYGLGVQVFRKSEGLWLETTLTDAWTLEAQNSEGSR